MNTQLSHAESAPVAAIPKRPISSNRVMIVLAICMALQITSYVMILPLFARRFTELGAGVTALGTSAMAYALAGTLAAPFMGALADRFGRRPIVLSCLAGCILAFTGYLFASSVPAFILLRGLAGTFTAGLAPAVTGSVADLAPTDRRAQWIGIVNGGASIGWIAGPLLGGVLYDRWGHGVPFAVAACMAAVTFIAAFLIIPETRHGYVRAVGKPSSEIKFVRQSAWQASLQNLRKFLPGSLSGLVFLLCIYFTVMFAWAFIEP
ncbi:MAG TPA: MFS transporter, partial [Anaerolineales bacterium]|nr:MFS transporter [Anaerolineales bacterium]